MSAEAKRVFDAWWKVFLGIVITFFGWLGARFVQKVDAVEASFIQIEISHGELKKDMEWMKQTLNDMKNEKRH